MTATAPTFVLQGYFGTGNFGDDWLLAAAVSALAAACPGARFIVRDHGDAVAFPLPGSVAFSGSERILARQSSSRPARLWRYAAGAWQQFRGAHWLVFSGGTQFHARHGHTSLALNALLCLLARARGLRVAVLGAGIAGIDGPVARGLLAVIIRTARVFVVRDSASHAIAGPRALLAADLAFTAPLPAPRTGGTALALTVYPPAWHEALGEALGEAAGMRDIVLLTVQRGGATTGDDPVLDRLTRHLSGTVTRRDLAGDGAALDGVRLVCGMRFHALLAAAQAGLPFVGIAHDPKIADLCARFSMPCLPLEGATGGAIAQALADAERRVPDPAALARCREEARRGVAAMHDALA